MLTASVFADDEPALPSGLEEPTTTEEPALPMGLDEPTTDDPALPTGLESDTADEPNLPMGLDEPTPQTEQPKPKKSAYQSFKDIGFAGFVEFLGGTRLQDDPYEQTLSAAEARLQLEWQKSFDSFTTRVTTDFYYDQIDEDRNYIDLHRGNGWIDLREAWIGFTPINWMDAKLGRQIFTWGTGDLLFLNDLFPKDWQAFFIGRDVQYLKAPSDAIKLSAFTDPVDIDVIYIPNLNPSRFIDGSRLSYFNPALGRPAGRDAIAQDDLPNEPQLATRFSKNLDSYELAAYLYFGNYNTPDGSDPVTGHVFYPRLNSYGASIRGPFAKGIGNFETAYYDSREDQGGDNPLIPNSELRVLFGYEQDLPKIATDFNLGLQYYLEIMMNHDAYLGTLPAGTHPKDEVRHVLTARLTKQLLAQTLTLSFFAFYSPSDNDTYMRPILKYKITDDLTTTIGANIFAGQRNDTFFGQFQKNTNIYASFRYSF